MTKATIGFLLLILLAGMLGVSIVTGLSIENAKRMASVLILLAFMSLFLPPSFPNWRRR